MPRKSALTQDREAVPTLTEISDLLSLRPILTLAEVARELRCSKAHLHNIIAGKVRAYHHCPSCASDAGWSYAPMRS